MSNEVEVIDVVAAQNYQAAHSVMVMEQWGNGETYNEDLWIERGRQAVRQTMEGMFELGRVLIILKEHTEHGRFVLSCLFRSVELVWGNATIDIHWFRPHVDSRIN